MQNTIMVQGLDSMSTNNLTHTVTQCAPLVIDYSQVLSAQQDLLTSICLLSVVIREYKNAQ